MVDNSPNGSLISKVVKNMVQAKTSISAFFKAEVLKCPSLVHQPAETVIGKPLTLTSKMSNWEQLISLLVFVHVVVLWLAISGMHTPTRTKKLLHMVIAAAGLSSKT